jgi:hypothetical protein
VPSMPAASQSRMRELDILEADERPVTADYGLEPPSTMLSLMYWKIFLSRSLWLGISEFSSSPESIAVFYKSLTNICNS